MAGNTFGQALRLTTFGESHGAGLGGVIDGCPAGLHLTEADIQAELDRRKPGQGPTATKRKESDTVRLLSGVYEGVTTGTSIAFYIANEDQRSHDYGNLAEVFRPGHADWGYFQKYNGIRDHRGGGRSSGRETAARVAGGVIARKILERRGVKIMAACVELGGTAVQDWATLDLDNARNRPYCAATEAMPQLWDQVVLAARKAGDTLGGIVRIEARNVPAGLGEPVFDKLEAVLAHAIMSIGAVKGFSVGDGFGAAKLHGSQNNDPLLPADPPQPGKATFASNHAGGILGGISSGQQIIANIALKPTSSITVPGHTINRDGEEVEMITKGRHDPCVGIRAVPIAEAMLAIVLMDHFLRQRAQNADVTTTIPRW